MIFEEDLNPIMRHFSLVPTFTTNYLDIREDINCLGLFGTKPHQQRWCGTLNLKRISRIKLKLCNRIIRQACKAGLEIKMSEICTVI